MSDVKMYWWNLNDLRGLVLEMIRAMIRHQKARLEFHPEEGKFYVVVEGTEALRGGQGHNFVHICPPDCPE